MVWPSSVLIEMLGAALPVVRLAATAHWMESANAKKVMIRRFMKTQLGFCK